MVRRVSASADPPDWDVDGLLSGNRFGFFGPDENCGWGWIPVEDAFPDSEATGVGREFHTLQYESAGVTVEWIERRPGYLSDWWFVEYRYKDYTCPGNRYPSAVYDTDMRIFVSECPSE
jgi:hypothetical protein